MEKFSNYVTKLAGCVTKEAVMLQLCYKTQKRLQLQKPYDIMIVPKEIGKKTKFY